MIINVSLEVEDPDDIDTDEDTGLTEAAYLRLVEGLSEAGFNIAEGPTRVNL